VQHPLKDSQKLLPCSSKAQPGLFFVYMLLAVPVRCSGDASQFGFLALCTAQWVADCGLKLRWRCLCCCCRLCWTLCWCWQLWQWLVPCCLGSMWLLLMQASGGTACKRYSWAAGADDWMGFLEKGSRCPRFDW